MQRIPSTTRPSHSSRREASKLEALLRIACKKREILRKDRALLLRRCHRVPRHASSGAVTVLLCTARTRKHRVYTLSNHVPASLVRRFPRPATYAVTLFPLTPVPSRLIRE